MKLKEFEQWCYDRSAEGYLPEEIAIDCFLLIKDIYRYPFWKRRRIWKTIEIDIVENFVIPINTERRFDALRADRERSKR